MTGTILTHKPKRGKKTFGYSIYLGRDQNGKQLRKVKRGFARESEATQALAVALLDLQKAPAAERTMPTFKEFFWRWHRECAIRQYAPKTAERYGELGQYALKHFGDAPLDQLAAEGMTVFLNGLLDHGGQKTKQYPQGRPLAPKTVRHVGFLVQSVLKQAVDWDILVKNVMQKVKKSKVPRRRPRVIDRAGFDVVLRKAQNRRDFARVIVAMATGMRRGELCAVEWTDLNAETGILEVSKSLEETREGGLRIKGTKADEPRRFKLSREVLEVLREHKREQDRERELYGATYINRNLIFCRPNGIVNLSHSERVWADWRREFEIVRPPLPFARLRRTETSRVGDEPISASVAQRKIDFGRHRGAIESAELVGVI